MTQPTTDTPRCPGSCWTDGAEYRCNGSAGHKGVCTYDPMGFYPRHTESLEVGGKPTIPANDPTSENLATVRVALDWQRDEGYLEALAALDALEQELAWAADKTWGITQMLLGVEAERDAAQARLTSALGSLSKADSAFDEVVAQRDAAQAELAETREQLALSQEGRMVTEAELAQLRMTQGGMEFTARLSQVEASLEGSYVVQQELRDKLAQAREAIGSLLWVLNNVHNADTDLFRDFAHAAKEDARRALAGGEDS